MFRSALIEISSIVSLKSAWAYIYKNSSERSRKTKDITSESINGFSVKSDKNLKELSKEIRSKDGYKFSPLKAVLLPKSNGKYRVICVPTVQDRIVQRALLDFLSIDDKCKLLNKVSYGFVKGRGAKDAAIAARNHRSKKPWAYKTDISQFFDNIPRADLKKLIKSTVKHTSLHSLLMNVVDCELFEYKGERERKIKKAGIYKGKGVRQGMPLSPFYANLILRDFDSEIQSKGFDMIRYADDLIILCKAEDECSNAHDICKVELNKLKLSIPEPELGSKTEVYSPGKVAEFLGVGLVPSGKKYSVNIAKLQTEKIKQRIIDFSDFKTLLDEGVTIAKLGQKLEGMITGYLDAYNHCDNLKQLSSALDSSREKALKKIYVDGLGMNLELLSPEKNRFLGLK